jgi:hypothetical protein
MRILQLLSVQVLGLALYNRIRLVLQPEVLLASVGVQSKVLAAKALAILARLASRSHLEA